MVIRTSALSSLLLSSSVKGKTVSYLCCFIEINLIVYFSLKINLNFKFSTIPISDSSSVDISMSELESNDDVDDNVIEGNSVMVTEGNTVLPVA